MTCHCAARLCDLGLKAGDLNAGTVLDRVGLFLRGSLSTHLDNARPLFGQDTNTLAKPVSVFTERKNRFTDRASPRADAAIRW